MKGLPMHQCTACGHVHFPAPLLCHRCHASRFETVTTAAGAVTEMTTWTGGEHDRQFAAIQTALGPVAVAWVTDGGASRGGTVLFDATPHPQARTAPPQSVHEDIDPQELPRRMP